MMSNSKDEALLGIDRMDVVSENETDDMQRIRKQTDKGQKYSLEAMGKSFQSLTCSQEKKLPSRWKHNCRCDKHTSVTGQA